MDIIEFYNKIVDTTKATGQGVPMFIAERLGLEEDVNKMGEDGYLVKYTQRYNHLPNDETICINGVYNVEKDEYAQKGIFMSSPLHFIRRWLSIDQTDDVGFKMYEGKTGKEVYDEWVERSKEQYHAWICENVAGLEAIKELTHITKADYSPSVSKELIDFIKEKKYYEENLPVGECRVKSNASIDNLEKIISAKNDIIKLMEGNPAHAEEMAKYKRELIEDEQEMEYRKSISKLFPADSTELIHDFVEALENAQKEKA